MGALPRSHRGRLLEAFYVISWIVWRRKRCDPRNHTKFTKLHEHNRLAVVVSWKGRPYKRFSQDFVFEQKLTDHCEGLDSLCPAEAAVLSSRNSKELVGNTSLIQRLV